MRLFKRRTSRDPAEAQATGEVPANLEERLAEIERLMAANRVAPDRAIERRLLRLRHRAGIELLHAGGRLPPYPEADVASLPAADGLPEVGPAELTPGLLRAGILRNGCLLVRGLVDRGDALAFAAEIDRAFGERTAFEAGRPAVPGYYEEFVPEAPFDVAVRSFVKEGGGILVADSPKLACRLFTLFEDAGLARLAAGYLGEPPLLSAHKTTLRKVDPSVDGAWHQDGAFMGDARALNLWLALSDCGEDAPGLELMPLRLEEIVIEHGAMLDVELTRAKARAAAGGVESVRPIFEPGDALFFDELFLHRTNSIPSMTRPRFAIESWFFGGSFFPPHYAPIAV